MDISALYCSTNNAFNQLLDIVKNSNGAKYIGVESVIVTGHHTVIEELYNKIDALNIMYDVLTIINGKEEGK